jgi:hypothetical protein
MGEDTWQRRYDQPSDQRPVFIPIAADTFAAGYNAAQTYRTSRQS